MTDQLSIPQEEWRDLQQQVRQIRDAVVGTIDGEKPGMQQKLVVLERDMADVRHRLGTLEEGRQWLNRLVVGALVSTIVSILMMMSQVVIKK